MIGQIPKIPGAKKAARKTLHQNTREIRIAISLPTAEWWGQVAANYSRMVVRV